MNFLTKVDHAKDLISDALEKYPRVNLGCSFGKDSMVALHIAYSIIPTIQVFSVLADTEFQETYNFARYIVDSWKLNYTEYVFSQVDGYESDRSLCCGTPKVEKTKEAVSNVDAWISGVRSTEGITRANFKEVEERGGLVKINPILEFTELDIWRYTAVNNLPVNPKYKEGYRSLGCKFCSSPEENENESERAGRWKDTAKAQGECGIHVANLRE